MGSVTLLIKLSVLTTLVAVVWKIAQSYTYRRLPPVVEGFFLPEYRPVAELFRKYVEDGTERGGSFAVYHKGEPLIELWGGYADLDSKRPWREDTVTMVWSCAKGAVALAIAKLVERGLLDYKAEVRQYWPEFAQNGKDNITLQMLLSHQAGLLTLGGESLSLLDYQNDWQKIKQYMEKASTDFPPGSMVAYHSFTLGMYADALIRLVDPQHRNLSQFFQEEFAGPLGIDFYIGLPKKLYHRAARVIFPKPWEWSLLLFDPEHHPLIYALAIQVPLSLLTRANKVLNFFESSQEILNDPHHMEVGQPSLMGYSSAKHLARLYSVLTNGQSTGGSRILSADLVKSFSVPVNEGLPRDIKYFDLLYSEGFKITRNAVGLLMFGHDGYGGQQAAADSENNVGISYTTNFLWYKSLRPPDHVRHMEKVFYECFFQKQKAKDKD